MQIYVVRQGDTIDNISNDAGVDPLRVAFDNQIEYPYRLAVGQSLLIAGESTENNAGQAGANPDGTPSGEPAPQRPESASDEGRPQNRLNGLQISNIQAGPVWMNGYAYPWIDDQVLSETCRYLTSISIFSYGFTESGELVPPLSPGEDRILQEAKRQNVIPALVLTPLGADGRFNNNLVSALVRNIDVQQKLIRELWETVQNKGYGEIDVDFEYILAEDRELYADFVRRLRTIMNLFNKRVTVALAPKTSSEQKGLLYEGIDYKALGEAANSVLLMTYEWGYTYGPSDLW